MPPLPSIAFPLEEGEDNIVARLKSQIAYYALAITTVMSLGVSSDEDILKALKKGPCIFVVHENDHLEQNTELAGDVFQNGWRIWRVLVLATSMRGGPHAARRGELGAYHISDLVKLFLLGFDPVTNSATVTNFPLHYLGCSNMPSPDSTDYVMMMRFAHPLEANTANMV